MYFADIGRKKRPSAQYGYVLLGKGQALMPDLRKNKAIEEETDK